jgi:hypothetical protein
MIRLSFGAQRRKSTLRDLWNILAIEDGIAVTSDPPAVTAVCYFPPFFLKDPAELEDELASFVRSLFSLPVDSLVSVYLVKQFKDYPLKTGAPGKHAVMNFLEERRVARLNAFASPEYHPFFSITLPIQQEDVSERSLKDRLASGNGFARLSDPALLKRVRSGMDMLDSVIEQIKSRFGGACGKLSTPGLIEFLGILLNHGTTSNTADLPSLFTSDLFSRGEQGITWYGGRFHATLSIRHSGFPQSAGPDFSGLLYSDELKAVPFLVKTTLRFPDAAEAKRKANAMVSRISIYSGLFQKLVKDLLVQKDRLDKALLAIEEEGGRLLDLSYVVHTWAETPEVLDGHVKTLTNVFRGKEMILLRDTYNHKATFHALPPFAGHFNKITTRMISMNTEPFLPLLYPAYYRNPEGKPPEVPVYFHNTKDVLMSLDLMDPRDPSWNGIICGGSGSGKSFMTNYLLMNHLKANGKVFVIDKGGPGQGSFRNLVLNLPTGRYIELRFVGDAGFTVNFFDGPLFIRETADGRLVPDLAGAVDAYKESFLIQVITLMCLDDPHGRLSKTEEGRLSESLREAFIETNNNDGNVLTLERFAESWMMERFHSLYDQMSKYIGSGIYARFFRATTKLDEVDVFCFDLEGLSEHPDLETILTLIITRFTYDLCIRNRGFRKMVVLDEAWAQLSGGGLSATVEGIWRTIRKHGGFIYCVTQSYDDILRSPIGPALLANTTHYFMCGASHSMEALSKLKATGSQTHTMDAYDFECIQGLRFNPPEYADYYLMTPIYKGTLRLRPSPYDYWFSTTNAKDKERIEAVKKRLGASFVTPEVLEELVHGRF